MNTDQMDKSNLQVHVMSDQVEPLDAMQISVSTFLQNQISKANVCITDSNDRMMEISTRLIEQRGLLRAIHNDGTNNQLRAVTPITETSNHFYIKYSSSSDSDKNAGFSDKITYSVIESTVTVDSAAT